MKVFLEILILFAPPLLLYGFFWRGSMMNFRINLNELFVATLVIGGVYIAVGLLCQNEPLPERFELPALVSTHLFFSMCLVRKALGEHYLTSLWLLSFMVSVIFLVSCWMASGMILHWTGVRELF